MHLFKKPFLGDVGGMSRKSTVKVGWALEKQRGEDDSGFSPLQTLVEIKSN